MFRCRSLRSREVLCAQSGEHGWGDQTADVAAVAGNVADVGGTDETSGRVARHEDRAHAADSSVRVCHGRFGLEVGNGPQALDDEVDAEIASRVDDEAGPVGDLDVAQFGDRCPDHVEAFFEVEHTAGLLGVDHQVIQPELI